MNELALQYPLVPVKQDLPKVKDDPELQYILNLHKGQDHVTAGLNAGYSLSYVKSKLYQKRYNPKFLQSYIEVTKTSFAYLICKVLKMDKKYLDKVSQEVDGDDFTNYTKSKHTLDRISKLSGFIKDQPSGGNVTINIAQIQQLLQNKPK